MSGVTGAQDAAIMSELPSAVPAWPRATDPVAEPGRRGEVASDPKADLLLF